MTNLFSIKIILCLTILIFGLEAKAQLSELHDQETFLTWTKRVEELRGASLANFNEFLLDDYYVSIGNRITEALSERRKIIMNISITDRTEEDNENLNKIQERLNSYKTQFVSNFTKFLETKNEKPKSEAETYADKLEEIQKKAEDVFQDLNQDCKNLVMKELNNMVPEITSDIYKIIEIENILNATKASIDQGARNICELENKATIAQINTIENTIHALDKKISDKGDWTYWIGRLGIVCGGLVRQKKSSFDDLKPVIKELETKVKSITGDPEKNIEGQLEMVKKWMQAHASCEDEKKTVECDERMEPSIDGNCKCKKDYVLTKDGNCKTSEEILKDLSDGLPDEEDQSGCNKVLQAIMDDFKKDFDKIILKEEENIEYDLNSLKTKIENEEVDKCDVNLKLKALKFTVSDKILKLKSFESTLLDGISRKMEEQGCQKFYVHNTDVNFDILKSMVSTKVKNLESFDLDLVQVEKWVSANPCIQTSQCEGALISGNIDKIDVYLNAKSKLELFQGQLSKINALVESGINHPCEVDDFYSIYNNLDERMVNLSKSNASLEEIENYYYNTGMLTHHYDALKSYACYKHYPEEIIALVESNENKIRILSQGLHNSFENYKSITSWIGAHPCPNTEENNNDTGDCDPERTIRLDNGACQCKEKYYIEINGKCFSEEEMEEESHSDADKEKDCNVLVDKALAFKEKYSTVSAMINLYDAHAQQIIQTFNDASIDHCNNATLATLMSQIRVYMNQLEVIKYDHDYFILDLLREGVGCSENVMEILNGFQPLLGEIESFTAQWEQLYSRYLNEFNCKEENIDSATPDAVRDPERNPTGEITGSGYDIPGDGIDNDGDGLVDEDNDDASGFGSDDKILDGLDDIVVTQQTVNIRVWDHGCEDEDIITLKINEMVIFDNLQLTLAGTDRDVTIPTGVNTLELIAVSGGRDCLGGVPNQNPDYNKTKNSASIMISHAIEGGFQSWELLRGAVVRVNFIVQE